MVLKNAILVAACALAFGGNALASEVTASSEVTGEIVGTCTISTDPVTDFGQVNADQAGTTIDRQLMLSVTCSKNFQYGVVMTDNVPMEFITTALGQLGAAQNSSLMFSSNALALANGGAKVGTLAFWADNGKTNGFPVGTVNGVRSGTGAAQSIPVFMSWTLPAADDFVGNSYGKWKVTNTYKVIF